MLIKNEEVVSIYSAYQAGAIDTKKPLPSLVAYKICKGMELIKDEYKRFNKKVVSLQNKYNWDEEDLDRGGLDGETYKLYAAEYEMLENETVEINISQMSIEDVNYEISTEEMKVLYFMISDD